MVRQNIKGMTIIEVLIASAIVAVMISVSLVAMQAMSGSTMNSSIGIALEMVRINMVTVLQDDGAWASIVDNNSSMSCLKTYSDCAGQSGAFAIYDASGTAVYDPAATKAGFARSGAVCSNYTQVNGNLGCPIFLAFNWRPLCPAVGACINPPVEVTGQFQVTDSVTYKFNLTSLNFQFLRKRIFGAPQQSPVPLAVFSGSDVDTDGAVSAKANVGGAAHPTGVLSTAVDLQPGSNTTLIFQHDVNGVGNQADATNWAVVCFYKNGDSPTVESNCIYEWRQDQGRWSLWARGVRVYTAPLSDNLSSASTNKFIFNNGAMVFHYTFGRRYFFSEVYTRPLRVAFLPASTLYSPLGFQSININFQ